jgi:hypothetical protein
MLNKFVAEALFSICLIYIAHSPRTKGSRGTGNSLRGVVERGGGERESEGEIRKSVNKQVPSFSPVLLVRHDGCFERHKCLFL